MQQVFPQLVQFFGGPHQPHNSGFLDRFAWIGHKLEESAWRQVVYLGAHVYPPGMVVTGNRHLMHGNNCFTRKSFARHPNRVLFEVPRTDEYRRNPAIENLAPVLANLGQFVQQLAIAEREDA